MRLYSFSRYGRLLWITALVLVVSGTLLLAACGGPSETSPTTSTPTPTTSSGGNTFQVNMVETGGVYSFDPVTLTIPKGATVIWTNKSDSAHTVTSDTSAFTESGTLSESQTFQMVFATAGTYAYHCKFHPSMKATIVVTA